MSSYTEDIILVGAGFLIGAIGVKLLRTKKIFNYEDEKNGMQALSELKNNEIEEISDDELENLHASGRVMIAKHPVSDSPPTPGKEHLAFFNPVNTRYWPYYYYTFPYQYTEGGAYPPGLYSRLYNWQPGYDTAGWSYWMRPGISYTRWPRNRWVSNNSSYYYINNGNNRTKDYI